MFKRLKPEFWIALLVAFAVSLVGGLAFGQEIPGFESGGVQAQRTPTVEEYRQFLLESLDLGDAGIDEAIGLVRAKRIGPYDLHDTNLGMVLETKAINEEQKVRHTFITHVFAGSPADRAGIKPGDRLLKLGDEELDNETGKAVLLYLSKYDKEVPVTVLRGSLEQQLTLTFEPVPCFAQVLRTFSAPAWEKKLREYKADADRIRRGLKSKTQTELSIKANILTLQLLGNSMNQAVAQMEAELDPTRHPACRASIK